MYAHVHSPINSCTPMCTHQSTHVRPRALTKQLMYAHVYSPNNSCTPTCTHQSTHIRPLDSRPLDSRPLNLRPLDSRPLNSRPLNSRPLNYTIEFQTLQLLRAGTRVNHLREEVGFLMLKHEWSCAAALLVQQQSNADHMNSNQCCAPDA